MVDELTLTFVKPDAMCCSLVGEIQTAFSQAKLMHAGSKVMRISRELAEEHYRPVFEDWRKKHNEEPPFKEALITYIMGLQHYPEDPDSRRISILILYGENAIEKIRDLVGNTWPNKAKRYQPTSIRGKHGYMEPILRDDGKPIFDKEGNLVYKIWNCVHASDKENAEREVKLFMKPDEINEPWRIYPQKSSEEHFYFSQSGEVIKTRRPGAKTIIAPGDTVWTSDFKNLIKYRDKKGTPAQSLNSIILKYNVILNESLTWE